MKRTIRALAAAIVVIVMGCVVIPDTFEARIYIDIRHIEQQAEAVLDYVEGKTDTLQLPAAEPNENFGGQSFLRRTLEFVSPIGIAYAQELKDSSPLVTQIANKMKERHPVLEGLKKKGAVGENNRGLAELVHPEAFQTDEEKNQAQRVVAAENEDRKALYQEIARLNRESQLDVSTVERVYAQKRLERAQPREIFQLPAAGPDFDKFKQSAQGKKLGDEAQPGAWVKIP